MFVVFDAIALSTVSFLKHFHHVKKKNSVLFISTLTSYLHPQTLALNSIRSVAAVFTLLDFQMCESCNVCFFW